VIWLYGLVRASKVVISFINKRKLNGLHSQYQRSSPEPRVQQR
jgi:hypothetical protein